MFKLIDLEKFYNNNGFSYRNNSNIANFTGVGSSYPAEELPESNSVIEVNKIPFKFPVKEKNNNIELSEQVITLESNKYKSLHILGAADNGSYSEPITLSSDDSKSYKIYFGLTDWISKDPQYNEQIAFRCNGVNTKGGFLESVDTTIWYQKINLKNIDFNINKIEFTDNPGLHIFSLTLEY